MPSNSSNESKKFTEIPGENSSEDGAHFSREFKGAASSSPSDSNTSRNDSGAQVHGSVSNSGKTGRGGKPSKKGPKLNDQRRRQSMLWYVLIAMLAMYLFNIFAAPQLRNVGMQTVQYSEFLQMVDEGRVETVSLDTQTDQIVFRAHPVEQSSTDSNTSGAGAGSNAGTESASGTSTRAQSTLRTYSTTLFPNDTTLVERLNRAGVKFSAEVRESSSSSLWLYMLILYILPIAVTLLGGWLLNRRLRKSGEKDPRMTFGGFGFGGLGGSNLGRSGAREVKGEDTGVTFKDVAGQDEAKESLAEIVSFLENPNKYANIGAKLPHGALLVGPPGTGKTLLAKAVAGEAKVPFFSISGSEFVEMFVGRGAAKVRDLFQQANEKAPCIVFIDEIDTVGKRRDSGLSTNDEREQTLNQLLSEMDGFDNHKGIVVLAATNRPESLDPALLRPGRFDRRIPVELPDLAGRKAILELHSNDVKITGPIDLDVIARSTPGASGADLANIINEAALRAVRMGRQSVTQEDLVESVEVVIAGEKRKSTVLSEHEKKVVAYHEIGHAIVAAVQNGQAPVQKITIVPRTSGALGYTMQVEADEHFLTTKQEAMGRLAVLCGGRAAEELVFNEITTGASNDIERATEMARAMVTQYGFSEEFGMVALGTVQNRYLSNNASLSCSEGTAERVDAEVIRLVETAHGEARKTLEQYRFKLHELARYLQVKETVTGEEFMNIFTSDDGFAPKLDGETQ